MLVFGRVIYLTHEVQHRRHEQSVIDALRINNFPHLHWVKSTHQYMSSTNKDIPKGWSQRTHMEHRHRIDITISLGQITCRTHCR